ncbi:MAG: response regulator [Chitinophagaceae bacterium]
MIYTIVLADDHSVLLQGLLTVIHSIPNTHIVATARNGLEAIDKVATLKPHLIMLDLNMPGMDGLKCLLRIKTEYPKTKVLIFTNYYETALIDEVRRLGADGFLLKDASAETVQSSITSVLNGGSYYPNKLLKSGMADTVETDSYFFDNFLKKFQLTKREVDIIRLICKEMNTKEIAHKLNLSELTISTHRKNIFRKLEIKNMAGLVSFAKEHQLF